MSSPTDPIEFLAFLLALFALGWWLAYLPLYAAVLSHTPREDSPPGTNRLPSLVLAAFIIQLLFGAIAWRIRLFPGNEEMESGIVEILFRPEGSVLLAVGLVINFFLCRKAARLLSIATKSLGLARWSLLGVGLLVAAGQLYYAARRSPFPNEEVRLQWILHFLFLASVWVLLFRPVAMRRPLTVQGIWANGVSRMFCILWGLGYFLIPTF